MKYYAVRQGRHPGIYQTWAEAQKEVSGFKSAIYKSFPTKAEAEDFMNSTQVLANQKSNNKKSEQKASNLADFTAVVYTDGGSRNTGNVNGGHVKKTDKAAWAYLIKMGKHQASASGGEYGATNNRMEVMALIKALQKLKQHNLQNEKLLFVLDSKYVLNPLQQNWLVGWAKKGWQRSNGELKNKELWQEVYRLLTEFKNATFEWTKGHAVNEGNNFVDELLNKTMDKM